MVFGIKIINRIIGFASAAAVCISLAAPAAFAADSGDVVVVGANPDFGISKSGGDYSGFAYDILKEIQNRTGHRYSFVEAEPAELMQMLEDGKIDVIPCVSEYDIRSLFLDNAEEGTAESDSPETVESPAYSVNAPITSAYTLMTKFSAIYINDHYSDVDFFDTRAIRKLTIGYLKENEELYFSDGKFVCGEVEDARFVRYHTEAQMRADFESGEVDAVVKSCFRPWANESIAYQFYTKECAFIIAPEDTTLAAEFDQALREIFMCDSQISSNLYEKHLAKYGAQKYAYSRAEKEYMQSHPVLTLAYNRQSRMMDIYDRSGSYVSGPIGSIIEQIERISGFRINIRVCESLAECVSLLERGEADVICGGVNSASISSYGSCFISASYMRTPIVAVGKAGLIPADYMKIAVPFNGDDIAVYLKTIYPNATFLPYANNEECLNAVLSGEADIVYADAYEVIYLLGSGCDLEILEVSSAFHRECFAYSGSTAKELVTIFDKSLAQLNHNTSIVINTESISELSEYESMSLQTFVQRNLWILAAIVAAIAIAVAIIIGVASSKSHRAIEIDPLTGGRSKHKFIEDALKLTRKTSADKWALVMFDINKFKFVNDRLGYGEGDRMLERLYKTIEDNLEKDEIGARLSDDNFVMAVGNAADSELSTKINNIFSEFERRNGLFVKYPVTFSAGVCRLGQCLSNGKDADIVAAIDRCNIAKRTLKGLHYSSIAFYDGKIRDKALREKDYESAMPGALARHEFQCYLQPKYGLKFRRIVGAEALIRWNSKDFGFVYPGDFIPLCEKNGFVVELDFFILEEVCKHMRNWIDSGRKPVVVSVNQSRLHLNYDDYIWRLREIVDKYEIPYEYIELELTESVLTENAEQMLKIMRKLHDIGFKLSIDDFGSGYSSLNMLKDMPADVVKIDREFFNGTMNSEKGRAVIASVVKLAKDLNMEVISEGVETLEQVEFLTEARCDMVQGFYFAKPMPADEFESLWFKELEETTHKSE